MSSGMQAFTVLDAIAAPLFVANIDTDKLIPHKFLRKPLSAGYRNFLFYDQRFAEDGKIFLPGKPWREIGRLTEPYVAQVNFDQPAQHLAIHCLRNSR